MKLLHTILVVALLALASCSGTRKLVQPQLDMPRTLAGNETDSATLADVEWWKIYTDSALIYIINQTLEHNRDLAAAAARVQQLKELYGVSKADFLPTISASAYANRETNDYYGDGFKPDPEIGLKATISWEADLWGGLAAAKKQAQANYWQSVENARALRITLIAEAASAYYRLLALDNELNIVRQTLYTRQENLNKAKLRFEGGLTSEIVYQQAQVEYATSAALVPGLERQRDVQRNAIALLMGRYPAEEIARGALNVNHNLVENAPVGVPSELLERRPDLRAAEAALKSALAGVGVTYAKQFPKLSIGLTAGWEDDDFRNLLRSPFTYMVGNIVGTVLDFGRNRRRYKASIAAYDQARLAYEQKVLSAFHEVDNAALTFRLARQTTERKRELHEAAQKYTRLAYAQYTMGVLNYIDVLDAQRRYFDAQVGLSNAVRDQYLALINLYKCLGGGLYE